MKERNLVRTSLSVATALVISLSTLTYASAESELYAAGSDAAGISVCAQHSFGSAVITRVATLSCEGERQYTCSECGAVKTEVIPQLIDIKNAEITDVASKYTYKKTAILPNITVTLDGRELKLGRDYLVSYSANVKPGKASLTVRGTGEYGGNISRSFIILPAKTTLSKVTSSKAATASVKLKQTVGADGYRIAYSTSKSFKKGSVKYVTADADKLSVTIKKLTGGKTYYFKAQAFKTISGNKYYGAYSAVKKVTVKQTSAQIKAAKQKKVCDYARANVGGAYIYGGSSFRATDCSGLTMQCFAQIGISLPHNAAAQASYGKAVSYKDMQPGDLIICCYGGHAALYIGDGYFVHATTPARGITIEPVSKLSYYHIDTIRRLI